MRPVFPRKRAIGAMVGHPAARHDTPCIGVNRSVLLRRRRRKCFARYLAQLRCVTLRCNNSGVVSFRFPEL